jgi:hypothetical protein
MLNANKIFTRRNVLWDREVERSSAIRSPGDLSTWESSALVVDFEPNIAGTVKGLCGLAGWGLGEVNGCWSWMLDGWLDAETELVTGDDGEGVWCGWGVETASEIEGGYVLDWAVGVLV